MPWTFYALLTAFSLATSDALSKRAMAREDEYVIAWVRDGYALPFLILLFFFIPIPHLNRTFWITLIFLLPMEIMALLLYARAIKLSPLSLTIPFMALSPVFIILTGFIFLGEVPDLPGFLGIVFITIGAYILNIRARDEGILGPIKAIGREKGSVLMIIVALIYSITSTLGKVAVQHSSPIFFGAFYPFTITFSFSIILGFRGVLPRVVTRPRTFIPIGFFTALMILSHFLAISMTEVAYMISVKRTSMIFSVIYGKIFFEEVNIGERLAGSLLMILGVILITLF